MFCLNPTIKFKRNGKFVKPLTSLEDLTFKIYTFQLKNNPNQELPEILKDCTAVKIPCGKCFACRINRYEEWSTRTWLEARQLENNLFITLTYNERNLPTGGVNKQHLSNFMKALREHFRRKFGIVGIRFFACAEYGKKYYRPHYHILLFGCPNFGDEMLYKKNSMGQPLFKSSILSHLWRKGFCSIGKVTRQSCDYVCRYLVKETYGKKPQELNDEFQKMSKHKGLGLDYLLENFEQIIKDGEIRITGNLTVKMPRYFDRKVKELIGNERFENEITKPRIEKYRSYIEKEKALTGLSEEQIIQKAVEDFKKKIKKLEREFEITEKE